MFRLIHIFTQCLALFPPIEQQHGPCKLTPFIFRQENIPSAVPSDEVIYGTPSLAVWHAIRSPLYRAAKY
jgi:hypothetical protein